MSIVKYNQNNKMNQVMELVKKNQQGNKDKLMDNSRFEGNEKFTKFFIFIETSDVNEFICLVMKYKYQFIQNSNMGGKLRVVNGDRNLLDKLKVNQYVINYKIIHAI